MCCFCVGTCNHVGDHYYCSMHAAAWSYYRPTIVYQTTVATTTASDGYVGRHRKGDPEAGA